MVFIDFERKYTVLSLFSWDFFPVFAVRPTYHLRQEKSKPIINQLKTYLNPDQYDTHPQSPIGKALAYVRNNWKGLCLFLTDGRIQIDNNATERDIKTFVMARKNFLFSCTQDGADSLGVHFSLIMSAKANGINPYHYYQALFKQLPHGSGFDFYESLLPWNIDLSLV